MKGKHVNFGSRAAFFSGKDVTRVPKAWGEEQWIVNKEYCGKKLVLKKNRRCSMHMHKKKDEVFYLEKGKVLLEMEGESYTMLPGDFIHITTAKQHRFTGLEDSVIFEFSTTHDEDDSYRTELSGHVEQDRFERANEIINAWKSKNILVIGDAMIDEYIHGSVTRVSPEAPIPVVRYGGSRSVAGGAANSAANIVSLGGNVTLLSVCGNDAGAKTLRSLLKRAGVTSVLIEDKNRVTTMKQRVVGGQDHQLVRIDREDTLPLSASLQSQLLKKYDTLVKSHDAILLSDYAKGVLNPTILTRITAVAKKHRIPVILDPKPLDASYLSAAKDVTVLTPNRMESWILAGDHDGDATTIARCLSKKMNAAVLVTLGADGMVLAEPKKGERIFPTHVREVTDVSGAGDTVAAVLTLCVASGATLADAADIANRAAGIVVTKSGTATLTADELRDAL